MRAKTWGTVAVLALGVALGSVAGCGGRDERDIARINELEGQLRSAEEQRAQMETRITELEALNAQLVSRLEALGQDVEGLQSERSSLQSSLTETQRALEELRERERQQQARLATFRQMLERFRAMIDSGRLRVRIFRNRMVVELPDNVLFDSGEAELREQGQQTLAEVASVLRSIEGRQFQVAGHTDNVPIRSRRFPSNWELSTARAVSVARYLIEQGISGERISAAGYADTQPVDSNDTDAGRAHNRRIEIQLVPNIDELPDLSALTGETGGGGGS
ncbi:OmpA/MotB family protein [Sandaracinus amylolyticus]|uniref:OmpA/MotB family protein n=1 Tax=Sandaracinus amylolyticus TaxID=927083 RepID=UPI001F34759A|nr:OmpA family protein [Sandaracinus amylolyticus]UJR81782.1 Flagellar motor rotation protein MotB [Sandaracinus amylolyticus]